MKTNRTFGWLLAAVLVALAMPVSAQDAAPAQEPAASSSGSGGGGGDGGGGGGLALELQGRIGLLNTNGSGLLTDAGFETRSTGFEPPAFIPLVTAGVRILDQRLFLGVGIGFYGARETDCDGGAPCTDLRIRGFNITPTVSYDVLVRGAARLYPVGMLNLARVGTISGSGPTFEGDFWWGLNLGLGIRGEINDTIGIGTEWGWGFARTSNGLGAAGETNKVMGHGAFGTIFFSAKIGL